MTQFEQQFGELVIPRLHNLVRAEAVCVAHQVESYSGAWDVVMHHARLLGALHLPEDGFDALEDWISTTLLNEIVEAERVRAER